MAGDCLERPRLSLREVGVGVSAELLHGPALRRVRAEEDGVLRRSARSNAPRRPRPRRRASRRERRRLRSPPKDWRPEPATRREGTTSPEPPWKCASSVSFRESARSAESPEHRHSDRAAEPLDRRPVDPEPPPGGSSETQNPRLGREHRPGIARRLDGDVPRDLGEALLVKRDKLVGGDPRNPPAASRTCRRARTRARTRGAHRGERSPRRRGTRRVPPAVGAGAPGGRSREGPSALA